LKVLIIKEILYHIKLRVKIKHGYGSNIVLANYQVYEQFLYKLVFQIVPLASNLKLRQFPDLTTKEQKGISKLFNFSYSIVF